MRLYRVLLVAPHPPAGTPAGGGRLTRVRGRLASQGLQVELLDAAADGPGGARARLSGYSGLVVLDDVPPLEPLADQLIGAARGTGCRVLDLRDHEMSDQRLDDWARTVLPASER